MLKTIRVFRCTRQKVRVEKTAYREASRLVHVTKYYVLTVKVKWSRYTPGVAKRVDGDIALLFHDRGTRRGWVVRSTTRPHFTPGKDPVPIFTGSWVGPRACLDGRKISSPSGFDPGRPARSQSLYRLSYPKILRTRVIKSRGVRWTAWIAQVGERWEFCAVCLEFWRDRTTADIYIYAYSGG